MEGERYKRQECRRGGALRVLHTADRVCVTKQRHVYVHVTVGTLDTVHPLRKH